MITRVPPLGASVPLAGLKIILATPVLDDCQFRLCVCDELLIEAMHVHALSDWLKAHWALALKLGGLGTTTIILGPACTVNVTETTT